MKIKVFGMSVLAILSAGAALLPDDEAERLARAKLARMTLEEKVSLCGLCATMYLNAIPRVGIDGEWAFSDCGHCMKPEHVRTGWGYVPGVDDRSTALPSPSALVSTWNVDLAARHGHVMGEQMRALGKSQMLGPGINILRNPLCGRNWEYMGEDPLLAGKMAAALVRATQSHGVAATPKHFCVNSQELNRFDSCSTVDDRALHEIYLPAFESVVREGGALSIMTAYNRYNGTFCSENAYLQKAVLRERWGFKGTIITDWGGQHSCDNAVLNGGGIEANCGTSVTNLTDFYGTRSSDKYPLATAVKEGRVPEAVVDDMAMRTLYVMAKTGFLTGAQDKGERLTAKHSAVARDIADEAIILAKNDRDVLPLVREQMKKIVVFGDVARTPVAHLGGSTECHPAYEVTFLDGLRETLGPDAEIHSFPLGCEAGGDRMMPIPDTLLETVDTSGTDAFAVRCWQFEHWRGRHTKKKIFSCFRREAKGEWDRPDHEVRAGKTYSSDILVWSADVRAPETGEFALMAEQSESDSSHVSISVDGREIVPFRPGSVRGRVSFEKGRVYRVTFSYRAAMAANACSFGWLPPSARRASLEAVQSACRAADAIIVFTGTSIGHGQGLESEGGDRSNMRLPLDHDREIAEILAWKLPKTVVVCRAGSPVELSWIASCDTLLLTSYLGQEAGRSMARVLFGEVNPSGKLAFSWPKRYADTPTGHFGERAYNATNSAYLEGIYVGYRWYEKRGTAVDFPFGYGLSYTRFSYGDVKVKSEDGQWEVSVPVTNVGDRDGAEVVQLYVSARDSAVDRPVKELKGFQKAFLAKGETRTLVFRVTRRDLAYYDVFTAGFRADAGHYRILLGSSSADIRQEVEIAYDGR